MPDFDFNEHVILENERVLLRPLVLLDYSPLTKIAFEDKTLLQYSPKQIYTPALLQQYIDDAMTGKANGIRYPFLIVDKEQQEYAGSTSICNVSNYDKRLEIGFTWYGKKFQRSGLNRHCKWLLLHYIFETLDFKRVEFKVDERNTASQVAVQKIGAAKEGNLRSHTLMSDGFRRNTLFFGILKEEWTALKANFPLND